LFYRNCNIAAKDKESRYIYCNENVAEAAGLDSPQQAVGKTDHQFCWHDQADFYCLCDRKVIYHDWVQVNQPEIQARPSGIAKILVSKNKLCDRLGHTIGIIASYIEVSNSRPIK